MIATVHGPGTATNIRYGLDYLIASKTGTAQVVSRRHGQGAINPKSLPMHLRHRALFIAYAPAHDPTIAVAVAIEGGGYGASTAAPIARKILDAWIDGKLPEGVEAETARDASIPASQQPAMPAPSASAPPAAGTSP